MAKMSDEDAWAGYARAYITGMLASPSRSAGSMTAYCKQAAEHADEMMRYHRQRWP